MTVRRRMIIIATLICFILAIRKYAIRLVFLPSISSCTYNYEYFDGKTSDSLDKRMLDTVIISDTVDLHVLRSLLNMKVGVYDFDKPSGYCDEYSLEFVTLFGMKARFQIQYGGHNGMLRITHTPLTFQLHGAAKEQLYQILDKYHRYDRIISGG